MQAKQKCHPAEKLLPCRAALVIFYCQRNRKGITALAIVCFSVFIAEGVAAFAFAGIAELFAVDLEFKKSVHTELNFKYQGSPALMLVGREAISVTMSPEVSSVYVI